ncbi:unnamed protein product, partial [Polarella glacialis]
ERDVSRLSAEIASAQSALGALVATNGPRSQPGGRARAPSPQSLAAGIPLAPAVTGIGIGASSSSSDRGLGRYTSPCRSAALNSSSFDAGAAVEDLLLQRRSALEESFGSSSAMRNQAEQMDVVLRASISRLESRVRVLEGQGVRADRRAAELAGLAQALTEEQRALLIRLDRLEEQLRTRNELAEAPTEEWLRRVGRLEREQRAAALNLRLVVSVAEEAQQRAAQTTRCFEDLIEGRLRPLEERSGLRPAGGQSQEESRPSPRQGAGASPRLDSSDLWRGSAAGPRSPGLLSERSRLGQLGEQLGERLGGERLLVAPSPREPVPGALLKARLTPPDSPLKARLTPPDSPERRDARGEADRLEARVQGLTDALEELRARVEGAVGGGGLLGLPSQGELESLGFARGF